MKGRGISTLRHAGLALAAAAMLAMQPATAQQDDARGSAPIDLTGRWVSVVTEDWRWRMVTPAKGDYASVPLNDAGVRVADAWEPGAEADSCLPFGAPALMRMPTRLRISWADANTLRLESDHGMQVREFRFASAAEDAGEPSRQGRSAAQWDGSALRVQTSGLLPGWLRRNGVPYSADTELTEYFNTHSAYGDDGFTVTTIVHDPVYLDEDFVTSSTFRRLDDGADWHPTPCVEPSSAAGGRTADSTTRPTPAEGLVVTDARVIDGTGGVIESGSVVVRDGRIVSVTSGSAGVPGALVVDADGRTLMPGFIDAHRHIVQGDARTWLDERAAESMREFLGAGFTTVLSAGDPEDTILELRRRTAAGDIAGPRIIAAARAPLSVAAGERPPGDPARSDVSRPPLRPTATAAAVPEDATRERVRSIAAAGFDAVKTVIITTPDGPETDTLRLIANESAAHGLKSVTHAVTVVDTLAAVEAGTHVLVHTPHIGMLTEDEARRIASSGIPMVSTLGIFVPFYDDGNEPIFRDELPYPWETISSAGQGPVNARLLWEAGTVYGFGTDTRYHPRETLKHELKSLFLVFSEQDILSIMTRNSAIAIGMQDDLGTLEPGKIADMVLLDGRPDEDVFDLLEVDVVIKEGNVVVDER